ncbi:MAG TPA: hypothetical protein ENH94_07535 [Phycisphaerales bacterium]|nr:hypothetical protein [Phycisphaerales bacterium]
MFSKELQPRPAGLEPATPGLGNQWERFLINPLFRLKIHKGRKVHTLQLKNIPVLLETNATNTPKETTKWRPNGDQLSPTSHPANAIVYVSPP